MNYFLLETAIISFVYIYIFVLYKSFLKETEWRWVYNKTSFRIIRSPIHCTTIGHGIFILIHMDEFTMWKEDPFEFSPAYTSRH